MKLFKRYLFFAAGLLIMAFGVAFSIRGDLGTSPISSLPYVLNRITGLTVGQMTIAMHCVLIVIQILILRKRFELWQLLQLPVAVVFGYMIDLALAVTAGAGYSSYLGQWALCAVGIVLVAAGVSAEFTADVVVLAGEGVVIAVSKATGLRKSNMKIAFDITLVAVSVILSLICLHTVAGVREGTLAAAVFVGMLTKVINPIAGRLCERFCGK